MKSFGSVFALPFLAGVSKSDAYATGLIAYALRQAGLRSNHLNVKRATDWLEANQPE